jgi:acyl dehydratase
MIAEQYYEDFEVGQRFTAGSLTIDKDHAVAFANAYDPQYFHIDEQAAASGIWGTLVVSGWHTAATTMRLKLDTPLGKAAGGLVGLGIDSMKWPRPVYPGDALSIVITIIEKRQSKSRPSHGIVKYKVETLNQDGALVMEMVTAVWVPYKNA